jgi:hypothetical protein
VLSEGIRRIAALGVGEVVTATQSVVLRDERTPTNWRSLSARLGQEGDLIIDGHDLGKGVESLFGCREYEWNVTVTSVDTPKLLAALNGGHGLFGLLRRRRNLLDALLRRFSGGNADKLESFLKENGIRYSFWNRIGD